MGKFVHKAGQEFVRVLTDDLVGVVEFCKRKTQCEKLEILLTVRKIQKSNFALFWQKFRESNVSAREVTKVLISRNIWQWISKFFKLHCITVTQILREINFKGSKRSKLPFLLIGDFAVHISALKKWQKFIKSKLYNFENGQNGSFWASEISKLISR